MADPLTDLSIWFGEFAKVLRESGVFELVGILIAVLIVGALGIGLFIGIAKVIKRGKEYVGSTGRIGTVKLSIRKESYITGNVNRNESFLVADVLERMKRIPQIKKDPKKIQGIKDMEELWRDGILYAYDMKVLDAFKTELPNDEVMLLSPIKIEDELVSWQDEKGEWSLTGSATSMFRRYPRNLQCSELTEHFDIVDIHKTKRRVYVLVPFTDTVNEKLMVNQKGNVVKDVLRGRQVFVNLINIPNKKDLATLSVYIPALDELYEELEKRDQKLKAVEEQRDEYNQLADDMKMELEGYKARLKTHPLIGFDKPLIPIPPKSLYGIAIGAVVAGFAFAMVSKIDLFARYPGLEYVFLGGAVAVVLFTIKLFEKKSPQEEFARERPGDQR